MLDLVRDPPVVAYAPRAKLHPHPETKLEVASPPLRRPWEVPEVEVEVEVVVAVVAKQPFEKCSSEVCELRGQIQGYRVQGLYDPNQGPLGLVVVGAVGVRPVRVLGVEQAIGAMKTAERGSEKLGQGNEERKSRTMEILLRRDSALRLVSLSNPPWLDLVVRELGVPWPLTRGMKMMVRWLVDGAVIVQLRDALRPDLVGSN